MIERLYANNFRCLVNFEIKLDETNLFLGPNGTGKSSVFDVLRKLQDLIARGRKVDEVLSPQDLSQLQSTYEQRFELDLRIEDGSKYTYALQIEHTPDRSRMRISEESLKHEGHPLFQFDMGQAQLYHDDYTEGPSYPFDWTQSGLGVLNERPDNQKLSRFRREIARIVVVHPCPPLFESEARGEQKILDPDMGNFVSWYRHMAQENMGSVEGLYRELRCILPGFDSIVLEESGESVRMLKARFQNAKDASKLHRYSFRQLSDGQRALVALYSLIFLADNHKTSLFIDEPDNYLALREVQPWVVSASEKCGETLEQATFISHHPVLIDYLGVEKGKWFTRSPEGPARVSNESKVTEGLSLSETVARGWE